MCIGAGTYVHVYLQVHMNMCAGTYGAQSSGETAYFQDLLNKLDLTNSARAAAQHPQGPACLCLPALSLQVGLPACTASTLSSVCLPNPTYFKV